MSSCSTSAAARWTSASPGSPAVACRRWRHDGVAIGGDLLDSRIVETQLTPLFGDGAVHRSTGLPLPRYLFTRLRSWQTLLELNTPKHMELIRRLKYEFNRPEQLAALETLVEKNYGVAFFQAVEGAKVRLSDHLETEVRLVNADLRLQHPLTRAAFEASRWSAGPGGARMR